MKSLKSKLILGISLFIVVLFSITAFLQVREKEKELINDISLETRSFAELTSDSLVEDYKLYLVPNSFVYFNRAFQDLMAKNEHLSSVEIVSYDGKIVYDSETEKDAKYQGEERIINNTELLKQIQAKNYSVKPLGNENAVFYKKTVSEDGLISYQAVDQNEKAVKDLPLDRKIDYVVEPADEEYSVIYHVSYQALAARISATQMRILMLAIFGVGLGILLAIIFGSNITKPLSVLKQGAEILATGDFSHRVQVKTKDEIYDLAQTFNKMAADLQESTKAMIYKERVGKELELAKQIQDRLLPKEYPKVPGLDICAGIIPAEEIGGDCYDFLMPSKEELVFYLGDVTGHGVPSGIVVSIANALFYSKAGRKNLDVILSEVNEVLKAKTTPNMFITLVLMRWMIAEQKFSYVSAGHEKIIHYKAAEGKAEFLPSGGLALGMIKDVSKLLQIRDVELGKGDVLFIYSDGIPEAWKNEKEMYGVENLRAMVEKYSQFDDALAIRNALLADVYIYRQGYKQMDDMTCIVVKKT